MVVVMAPDATDEQIDRVVERVESVGGEAVVSRGVVRTIIGLVGDIDSFHGLNLRSLPGVADVHRISDPFKLVRFPSVLKVSGRFSLVLALEVALVWRAAAN